MDVIQMVVTIVCSVMASSGFWAFIQAKKDKESAEKKMLLALGHDRIMELGMAYVNKGEISRDEYKNLHDYLYLAYKDLGGNGTGDKIMDEVGRLPIKAV